MARRLGAKEEWIAEARRETPEPRATVEGSFAGLEESWRAAIAFAELVNESGHAVDAGAYRDLAQHWDEGEIVEITLVAGLFAYFNRFNDALRVEVTK